MILLPETITAISAAATSASPPSSIPYLPLLSPVVTADFLKSYVRRIIHITRKEYNTIISPSSSSSSSTSRYHNPAMNLVPEADKLTFEITILPSRSFTSFTSSTLSSPLSSSSDHENSNNNKYTADVCYLNYFYYNSKGESRYNLQSVILAAHVSKIYIVRDLRTTLQSL